MILEDVEHLRVPYIPNACHFEPGCVCVGKMKSHHHSVTLLIINLHRLLPSGRQVVSSCFCMRSLGGSCGDGIYFLLIRRRNGG